MSNIYKNNVDSDLQIPEGRFSNGIKLDIKFILPIKIIARMVLGLFLIKRFRGQDTYFFRMES